LEMTVVEAVIEDRGEITETVVVASKDGDGL
jgi:hypothetical protein